MFIATKKEISVAIIGALGFLSASLLSIKTVKYFIGIGMFGVFFFSFYLVSENLDISMFLAISMALFMGIVYEYCVKKDFYSFILIIALATMGFIVVWIISLNLYRFNVHSGREVNIGLLTSAQKMKEAFGYLNSKF